MIFARTLPIKKALLYFVLCLLCCLAIGSKKSYALVNLNPNPVGTIPTAAYNYFRNCDTYGPSPAFSQWISLPSNPSSNTITIIEGTKSIALRYTFAGTVCQSNSAVTNTRSVIVNSSPAGVSVPNNTILDLNFNSGGNYKTVGTFRSASVDFTYTSPTPITSDVTIQLTTKVLNRFASGVFLCVPSPSGNRGSLNNYAPCVSNTYSFTVNVIVIKQPATATCSINSATITVGDSYTPSVAITHQGPAVAGAIAVSGNIVVQGQDTKGVSGSIPNDGKSHTLTAASGKIYNTAGVYPIVGTFTGTSPGRTVSPFGCPGVLTVKQPPPSVSCTVNNPTILAGDSTSLDISINNISVPKAPTLTYVATVAIDTKPNQTFSGSIVNGGPSVPITTANLPFGPGKYNVVVTVTGNAPTYVCKGTISSYNRPYVRAYGNDVLAGFGFYDTTTCPTNVGNVTSFTRGAAQSYSGSGSQLGIFARGQINGFRSASTLPSAAGFPELLSFANTILVNKAGSAYGGNFGTGFCMYNYWTSSSKAKNLSGTSVDISSLANGSYYIKQTTATPITVTGTLPNNRKVVLYVEGTALLRGATVGYAATSWTTITDIPSLYIIAKGNIAVGSDVRNLDGHFIAQKSNATDGRITSCVDPASAQPYASAIAQIANCNSKLVINGSFNAEHINLLRSLGSVAQAVPGEAAATSNAAEVFIYSIETFLSSQSIDATRQQTYDSITALPPSL